MYLARIKHGMFRNNFPMAQQHSLLPSHLAGAESMMNTTTVSFNFYFIECWLVKPNSSIQDRTSILLPSLAERENSWRYVTSRTISCPNLGLYWGKGMHKLCRKLETTIKESGGSATPPESKSREFASWGIKIKFLFLCVWKARDFKACWWSGKK